MPMQRLQDQFLFKIPHLDAAVQRGAKKVLRRCEKNWGGGAWRVRTQAGKCGRLRVKKTNGVCTFSPGEGSSQVMAPTCPTSFKAGWWVLMS
jgi:hypothetical protein